MKLYRAARLILVPFLLFCVMLSLPAAEPDVYDIFLVDDTSSTLNRLQMNIPQSHTIYDATDEDWATFYAEEGLAYSLKVEGVGSGLDPELWVYLDGPDKTGLLTDRFALGEEEFFDLLQWPRTDKFWVRVKAAEFSAGPTSYSLTVTGNWGGNIGMATISGTTTNHARPEGDTLFLPGSVPVSGRTQRPSGPGETPGFEFSGALQVEGVTTTPLYTESYWSYPEGTFSPDNLPKLLFSGYGGPLQYLDREWVVKWHNRFPQNFTLTSLGVYPSVTPKHSMELGIEMRSEALTGDLWDGNISWPDTTFQDIAPGDLKAWVKIFRWNTITGIWEIYDTSPEVKEIPGGWLAITHIDELFLEFGYSDFFAAALVSEVVAPQAEVNSWLIYP